MKRKVPDALEKAIDQQIQARAAKTRKPHTKATPDDEPKMTQAESIAQAFTTLRNAGLLPVSLEAQPASNIERIAEHAKTQVGASNTSIGYMPDQGSQSSNPPGRQVGVFESTLGELNALIATTDGELSQLLNTLQPYLPSWVFQPADDGEATSADSDFEYRPTSSSSLSPTQVALNNAMNELNLLRRRVVRLRNMVVL